MMIVGVVMMMVMMLTIYNDKMVTMMLVMVIRGGDVSSFLNNRILLSQIPQGFPRTYPRFTRISQKFAEVLFPWLSHFGIPWLG